ncbi:hypothetical protein J2R76_002660 [Bradyrhizobium sp. USDA 4532]|nr:hypothetical protein [Bradyrhizobium sp. USDA 4545]MCP1919069.1 hypothetical protein [Bradyrhizobium sp. USDA 4532]
MKPGDRKVRSPGNPDVVAELLQYAIRDEP